MIRKGLMFGVGVVLVLGALGAVFLGWRLQARGQAREDLRLALCKDALERRGSTLAKMRGDVEIRFNTGGNIFQTINVLPRRTLHGEEETKHLNAELTTDEVRIQHYCETG